MKLIKAGILIDGTGAAPLKNAELLIDGDTIAAINPQEKPADCEVYDYTGQVVLPGLINAHVHVDMKPVGDPQRYLMTASEVELSVNAYKHTMQLLRSGVTYTRSLGSRLDIDIKLRNMINSGELEGPGIVAAGPNISMTGGHGWYIGFERDGVDACRQAAREIIKRGADVVKFMASGGVMTPGAEPGTAQLTTEEMRVIVEEAHKAGRKTSTHAQGSTSIKNALDAGVDCVEHGIFLTEELVEQMLKQGTYLVATLAAPWSTVQHGISAGITEDQVRKSNAVIGSHARSFRMAYEAGVKIAMGTDGGTPFNYHYNSWVELKLMQDCGMKPMELIQSATSAAADCLDIAEQYGTLEVGKKADIAVFWENPLENIEALSRAYAVFKHGRAVALGE